MVSRNTSNPSENALTAVIAAYPPEDAQRILQAENWCREHDVSGLAAGAGEVAVTLAHLALDADTVIAGLCIYLPQELLGVEGEVARRFGLSVAHLLDGAGRMDDLAALVNDAHGQHHDAGQAERLRKMLLAMVDDIRVVLVKLAERGHALRLALDAPEEQRLAIAREIRDIYAPLANRLGVWQIKWEMEDIAFRILEPDTYRKIARLLDEKRTDREGYIQTVIAALEHEMTAAGLRAQVMGRPKHIYSIYNKMRKKKLDFSELYDVRAVRVLVPEVKDCYAVLGIVHNLWQPIPGEFDDYISHPKGNFYRSLHTAVVGPEDKAVEVQIRTFDMHQHAEYGVAAHWRYKEGTRNEGRFDEKIAWLRQLLEWKRDLVDAELVEQFRTELDDTIYVLTPQGKVIDLPRGATPIDFAYHVHTELGHRCRGAKVDGSIVPLTHALTNGCRVEIISAKQGGPSRDWLSGGFVRSGRARTKIRAWFKAQDVTLVISQGRALVERDMRRLGIADTNLDDLAKRYHFDRTDDFFLAVGRGDIGLRQLGAVLRDYLAPSEQPEQLLPIRHATAQAPAGILVEGVDNLLTSLAKCCKPAPPDEILGFVTRGRGVSIHRRGCPVAHHLAEKQPERMIPAEWGQDDGHAYPVDLEIVGSDLQRLLRELSELFAREKTNVTAVQTLHRAGGVKLGFTVEIHDGDHLQRLLLKARELPNVQTATRKAAEA